MRGDQSAGVAAERGGDGSGLRLAVQPQAASVLWQRQDSSLRGGQGFGADHARLFRRLHVLLDHGTRRTDYPKPESRIGRGRNPTDDGRSGFQRRHQRYRRPNGEYVSDALLAPRRRSPLSTPELRASHDLQTAGNRPWPLGSVDAGVAVGTGNQESVRGLGNSHGFARVAVRSTCASW